MAKRNSKNERIKRDFARYLKAARGKSETTIDAALKAIRRFEAYTGAKDFRTFRREQAIGFRDRLAETTAERTGDTLSASTRTQTLTALREFFGWLACQPGFKSQIAATDVDYLSPSNRDAAIAKAVKMRDFPSLEQILAVISAMPTATVIDRRNRALIAFMILTGIRDGALASLSLCHVDLTKSPPLVRQEPQQVNTKFAKAIFTYFFPVGDDFTAIVRNWIGELQRDHLFGPTAPLFPRTKLGRDNELEFRAVGIDRAHWSDASPIRKIVREAFERADLPVFPPHSFRHTLGHLAQTMCRTPEEIKAWSQNLGHENIATTLTSYGKIDPHRQGEVMGSIGTTKPTESDLREKLRALL